MLLLVSSLSARGGAVSRAQRVARHLEAGGWRVTLRQTTRADDLEALTASQAPHYPYVGALGGDGYIAAVAAGVVDAGSTAVLVPIPGGRGNDLCRSIGAGSRSVPRARSLAPLGAAGADRTARTRPLDGIWVEDQDGTRRLGLGVVSVGLDAWGNKLGNESILRSGPVAYGYGTLMAPVHFRGADFRVREDGVEKVVPGWLLSVSNSGIIGGGIRIVPSSDPFDGALELIHVERIPLRTVVPALVGVIVRRNADHPLVHVRRVSRLEILGPVGLPAMADGDEIGRLPLTLSLAQGVVPVLV